jgi:hypothetical protein
MAVVGRGVGPCPWPKLPWCSPGLRLNAQDQVAMAAGLVGQRWPYQRQDSDNEGPNRGHHDGEGGEANPFWGIAHPGSYRMRPVAGSLSGGREGSDLRGRAVG